MKNFTKPHPLQDAAFLTEVHHINEKGEDAGVVYCEMQARENTSEDRTHFQMVQHMYPGHCGYKVGRRGGGGGGGVLRQDSLPDGPAHVSRSLWVQGR